LDSLILHPISASKINKFKVIVDLQNINNKDEFLNDFFTYLKKYPIDQLKEFLKNMPEEYKPFYHAQKNFDTAAAKEFCNNTLIWYDKLYKEFMEYFNTSLSNLYIIKGKLDADFNILYENYKELLKVWKKEKDNTLLFYRNEVNHLIELDWYGAPDFLIAVQKEFNQTASIISWDEIRMIGWKITAALKIIEVADVAAKIIMVFGIQIDRDILTKRSRMDGSYFSDLLHFVVDSDKDSFADKRELTIKLLSELLRESEKISIYEYYNITSVNGEFQIDEMLTKLGWTKKMKPYAVSLESFFEDKNEKFSLKSSLNGNDLRICLESYTKDIIAVIVSNLEKQNEALYSIIKESFPEFRETQSGRWVDELKGFKLGSAPFIIYALGKEWKPAEEQDWNKIKESLRHATTYLNELSHLNNLDTSIDSIIPDLSETLAGLIKTVNKILTEMPWHFYPQAVRGKFPSIITGKAWCHNFKEQKTIRVLNWGESGDSGPCLVWNPSKRNPIMTDCKIISKII